MIQKREKLVKELNVIFKNDQNNFARILFHLKRSFDDWGVAHLYDDGFGDFKVTYFPFIMNIGVAGITNKELAKRLQVTKQLMSKTLKEIKSLNLIQVTPNPQDARSSLIELTEYGMEMVIHSRKKVMNLTKLYEEKLGKQKYQEMLDSLKSIMEVHEEMKG